jgi:hypothetical protein
MFQDTYITISKHIFCPDFDLVAGDIIQVIGFIDMYGKSPNHRFVRVKVAASQDQDKEGEMTDIDLTEVL